MIRASITRSYRSPQLQDLIGRPSINTQVPHQANTPDRAGNPDLARAGHRPGDRLREIPRQGRPAQHQSSPPPHQRPDAHPDPAGDGQLVAHAALGGPAAQHRQGHHQRHRAEAKFRADERWEGALPVSLRSNLSLFTSADGIPGPHNQIDAQPKGTLNLGADYRLRSIPSPWRQRQLHTPSSVIQQSLLTEVETDRKRVFDAFALWERGQRAVGAPVGQ